MCAAIINSPVEVAAEVSAGRAHSLLSDDERKLVDQAFDKICKSYQRWNDFAATQGDEFFPEHAIHVGIERELEFSACAGAEGQLGVIPQCRESDSGPNRTARAG